MVRTINQKDVENRAKFYKEKQLQNYEEVKRAKEMHNYKLLAQLQTKEVTQRKNSELKTIDKEQLIQSQKEKEKQKFIDGANRRFYIY